MPSTQDAATKPSTAAAEARAERLRYCEARITRGQADCFLAMATIERGKLYRDSFDTFEAYVSAVHGITRSTAYRWAQAGSAITLMVRDEHLAFPNINHLPPRVGLNALVRIHRHYEECEAIVARLPSWRLPQGIEAQRRHTAQLVQTILDDPTAAPVSHESDTAPTLGKLARVLGQAVELVQAGALVQEPSSLTQYEELYAAQAHLDVLAAALGVGEGSVEEPAAVSGPQLAPPEGL